MRPVVWRVVAVADRSGVCAQRGHAHGPKIVRRLRADADFRRDVEAAVRVGQPYSVFRGESRSSATSYEYDDDGRLTRSVTVHEPQWTDDDRLLVLALLQIEEDTCEICGHPKSECRDESTAGSWDVLTEVCQPGRMQRAMAEGVSGKNARGLIYMTKRTGG